MQDRGIQGFHTILSLLPTFSPSHSLSQLDMSNPVALISLDNVNMYNKLGLVPIFDPVVGVSSQENCTVLAGESLGIPHCLLLFLPFFWQY